MTLIKVKRKKLLVGAAVGTKIDDLERAIALDKSGVDILFIDTAHGHSNSVIDSFKKIRKKKIRQLKTYVSSRQFGSWRLPVPMHNVILKDYCEKKLQQAKMKVDTIQASDNTDTIPEKLSPFKPD